MAEPLQIVDRSYGIIPLRRSPKSSSITGPSPANTQVLLVLEKTGQLNDDFWTFPRGHHETTDLSTQHTAIRELEEETGQKLEIADLLDTSGKVFKEVYFSPFTKTGREVVYWVGLVRDENRDCELKLDEGEIGDARWCKWEEAMELLSFETTKEILRDVGKTLEEANGQLEAAVVGSRSKVDR
jgi:8-oxo-dGTP pyrophosphatase MutT (NUDIX family)